MLQEFWSIVGVGKRGGFIAVKNVYAYPCPYEPLQFITGLDTRRWTAVTASQGMAGKCEKAVAGEARAGTDRIIVCSLFPPQKKIKIK